jgi:hypothetical protein
VEPLRFNMERRMLFCRQRRRMFKGRWAFASGSNLRKSRTARRTIFSLCASVAVLSSLGHRAASGQETLDSYKFSRDAQQGKKIVPVPLNLKGKNPDLVYLGSYLVNAQAGCNSCHTCPSYKGNDPYRVGGLSLNSLNTASPLNTSNYLAGGTPFPGRGVAFRGSTIMAPNLTPDNSGLPGGLTYDDFKDAMQNGQVSAKPGHILQVMPWPFFRNLYESDLVAIYQFLSALPPAQPGTCTGTDQTGN